MTSKNKRFIFAWGYGLTALLLTLTVLTGFSAGTALGRQGTATPTPPAPTTGNNLDEARRLFSMAQSETERLDDFDIEAVILLTLRSLQAGYLPEADLFLSRMLDRMERVEMIYADPQDAYQYINDLAVSPDGRMVASAQNDGNLRLYDIQTARLLNKWPISDGGLNAVAFSPMSPVIAMGGEGGYLYLLDSTTGDVLLVSERYDGEVNEVAFNADGSLVAVVTSSGEVGVYETATGILMREFTPGYNMYTVAFSPDGQTLLVGDTTSNLFWWDIGSGELLLESFVENTDLLYPVFMPDGKHALIANGNGSLDIMDLTTGEITQEIVIYQDGGVELALSPDGKYVLIGAASTAQAVLMDTTTWEIVQTYAGFGYDVGAVAFSPDGQDVFLGMDAAEIHRRSVTPPTIPGNLPGHVSAVTIADYSPDGLLMMTADDTGLVQIWDAADQHLIKSFSAAKEGYNYAQILAGGFVNSGSIWISNFDLGMEVWDIETGQRTLQLVVPEEDGLYGPPNVTVSPDGKWAALAFYTNEIFLFDLTTGGALPSLRQNNGTAGVMQFSQDGTKLAVVGSDTRVRVFDVTTGRILKVLGEFGDEVLSVAFTPDATQVLVGQYQGRMQIVDVATGDILRTFQMEADGGYGMMRVAFSADTVRVMGLGGNGVVQVWDVPSAKIVRSFGDYFRDLSRIRFSPDESQVLTGSFSPVARLWSLDLATTMAQACAVLTHDLSAAQLEEYAITNDVPPCANLTAPESDITATWTPNPTSTLPVWTPLPTLPPTNTPTPSPTPRQFTAQAGENRGSLALGEVQQWTFEGQPGQAISIEIRADRPANDTDDATRARDNLLDTYLRVYTTFGVLLEENDDIDPGVVTDSQIIGLVPPYPGTVVIEVTSFDGMTAGDYTLVITVPDAGSSGAPTPTPSSTPS